MSNLKAKVAYLQGLSAGFDLNAESKEARILNGIIEILDEFADSVVSLEESHEKLEDYLESIDDDLYSLEDEIYGGEEEAEDGSPEDFVEVLCRKCGEKVYFDSEILEDDDVVEVVCPNCNEVVFVNGGEYPKEGGSALPPGKSSDGRETSEEDI
ncbi:MAG TPA: AraC family transcriptional regulator [Bacillota bacterium]|nr:AraC family transcriptional regulator [Bacillota bacterium]